MIEIEDIQGCVSAAREFRDQNPEIHARNLRSLYGSVTVYDYAQVTLDFVAACDKAAETLTDEDLDAVERAGLMWLATVGQKTMTTDRTTTLLDRMAEQRTRLGAELSDARIETHQQRRGLSESNETRRDNALERAERSRSIQDRNLGLNLDLTVSSIKQLDESALIEIAANYGYSDLNAFLYDINDKNSSLRATIKADAKRLK